MISGGIGLAIGAVLGVIGYRTLSSLAQRVEGDDTRKVLRMVANIDLVLMPTIGFLIGAFLWR